MTVPTTLTNNWQAVPIRRRIEYVTTNIWLRKTRQCRTSNKSYNKHEIVRPDAKYYAETDRFIKNIHVRHTFPKRKVMNKMDQFK